MKGKIFNAQKVQAILAGNKTMFREVIKNISPRIVIRKGKNNQHFAVGDNWAKCPYQVGQKIFVKESFCLDPRGGILYKTLLLTHDLPKEYAPQWKPAQHMKQEQSRLTLRIKEIRVKRLNSISEEDAIAEGFFASGWSPSYNDPDNAGLGESYSAMENFIDAWNSIHKKPEEKFGANPWVWTINFEVVK